MATKQKLAQTEQFSKAVCKDISGDVVTIIQDFLNENGYGNITVDSAGGSYSELEWTAKMRFSITKSDGTTPSQSEWNKYAELFRLKAEWLGRQFLNGQQGTYTIVGLNTKARSFNVMAKRDSDGKEYRFRTETIIKKMDGIETLGLGGWKE